MADAERRGARISRVAAVVSRASRRSCNHPIAEAVRPRHPWEPFWGFDLSTPAPPCHCHFVTAAAVGCLTAKSARRPPPPLGYANAQNLTYTRPSLMPAGRSRLPQQCWPSSGRWQ